MATTGTCPVHSTIDGVVFTITRQKYPSPQGVVIDYVHMEREGLGEGGDWVSLAGRLLQQHWRQYPLGWGERRSGAVVISGGSVRLYTDEPRLGQPVALPFYHLNEAEWPAVKGMAPPLPVLLAFQEYLMKLGNGVTEERLQVGQTL